MSACSKNLTACHSWYWKSRYEATRPCISKISIVVSIFAYCSILGTLALHQSVDDYSYILWHYVAKKFEKTSEIHALGQVGWHLKQAFKAFYNCPSCGLLRLHYSPFFLPYFCLLFYARCPLSWSPWP